MFLRILISLVTVPLLLNKADKLKIPLTYNGVEDLLVNKGLNKAKSWMKKLEATTRSNLYLCLFIEGINHFKLKRFFSAVKLFSKYKISVSLSFILLLIVWIFIHSCRLFGLLTKKLLFSFFQINNGFPSIIKREGKEILFK